MEEILSTDELSSNQEDEDGQDEDEDEEEEIGEDSSPEQSTSELSEDRTWIEWHCQNKSNEFLVEVDEDYVQDDFNLTGIAGMVPQFDKALHVILDAEEEDEDSGAASTSDEEREVLEHSAAVLYGLVHARFILTARGLTLMKQHFERHIFGYCPNINCKEQPVLPLGLADDPDRCNTKILCPKCREVYNCRGSRLSQLDGAYFGTTFAPLFLLTFEHLNPEPPISYLPRIYGFRVSRTLRDRLRYYSKPLTFSKYLLLIYTFE
eukprot:TRINITY_DN59196_c0_g1_i2.p1 TRINITY_DN59196_c0_g1~~TRINITY_DN59196_c0_g1_i2.p1  ORF type:complete len:264 (-),score=20.97 TRINITY_DN59196_c0_g1_i2:241-1032(-)